MERTIAYGLLIAGTVLGTLGGARIPSADWTLAGVGMAMLVVAGVILRRSEGYLGGAEGGRRGPSMDGVTDRVVALEKDVAALAEEAAGLSLPDLRDRLGDIDRDYLRPLGDEAPGLLPSLGPSKFAATFGTYAGAERALHRAWSAATDGHRPEALASLELGRKRLAETVATL